MRLKLGGMIAGMILALITIMTTEAAANKIFNSGLPADLSATMPAARQPTGFTIAVLIGWFLGALVGSGLAVYISRSRLAAWAVAGVILVGVALRLATEGQPGWMLAVGPVAPLLGAWAGLLAARRRLAVEPQVT